MTLTIGQRFAASNARTKVHKGSAGPEFNDPNIDTKTLMTTAAGFGPESQRDTHVVAAATRTPTLLDLVPSSPTTASGIYPYMEETTYTNNAAEVAEGGSYGEAALGYTQRNADVRQVAVWIPVTDEQLEDVSGLAAHVDQRLGFMLRQRLELQMLVGNGATPNLRGILNTAGIQTQPKGADTAAVALRKAKTKVQVPGYGVPNLTLLNPTNSEAIDLAAAADALAPFVVTNELWDVPRYETDALTAGTALVGDFANYCALKVRRGITLQVTNSHGSFFVEGKQAIKATIRAAWVIYRPAAFVQVTGL